MSCKYWKASTLYKSLLSLNVWLDEGTNEIDKLSCERVRLECIGA